MLELKLSHHTRDRHRDKRQKQKEYVNNVVISIETLLCEVLSQIKQARTEKRCVAYTVKLRSKLIHLGKCHWTVYNRRLLTRDLERNRERHGIGVGTQAHL